MFPQICDVVEPVVQVALSDDDDMDIDSSSLGGASSRTMSAPFLLPRLVADWKTQRADVQGPVRSKPWPTLSVLC